MTDGLGWGRETHDGGPLFPAKAVLALAQHRAGDKPGAAARAASGARLALRRAQVPSRGRGRSHNGASTGTKAKLGAMASYLDRHSSLRDPRTAFSVGRYRGLAHGIVQTLFPSSGEAPSSIRAPLRPESGSCFSLRPGPEDPYILWCLRGGPGSAWFWPVTAVWPVIQVHANPIRGDGGPDDCVPTARRAAICVVHPTPPYSRSSASIELGVNAVVVRLVIAGVHPLM